MAEPARPADEPQPLRRVERLGRRAARELAHGVRFDTNYYYFPATWVRDRPGLFTGSGMPMRSRGTQRSLIDVYQAATRMRRCPSGRAS